MSSRGGGRGRGNGFQAREQNGFDNPSMAPSVAMIDGEWDKAVQRKLSEFAQNTESQCLTFPPNFTNVQRKRIHELATRFGLTSSSVGREPNRRCVVRHRRMNLMSSVSASETSPITLTPSMRGFIRDFIRRNPIFDYDIARHNSSKTAQKSKSRHRNEVRTSVPQIPPFASTNAFRHQREQLPAFAKKNEILAMIQKHQVVLITGGTGCGKTTQIPQFLLEEAQQCTKPLRIICTQPRRLPAIAVAERVSKERGESLGHIVGYHIRLEQKTSERTILTYCTSGVLLRMLTQDEAVRNITHIILDEIHEREMNTDYLLIALKQAVRKDSKIKIILMSATMEGNLEMFKRYFDGVAVHHVDIPSRLYNVEKFFLGDVLAMTAYAPPESIFSGGSFGNSNSFPSMSQWGRDESASNNGSNWGTGSFTFNQPPPQPQQPQPQALPPSQELFNNVAQQLATSQASAVHQQHYQQQQQYQSVDSYSQSGMHHSATWAGGMDKTAAMPDVINMACTPEDIRHFQQDFQDPNLSQVQYMPDQQSSWHQPSYNEWSNMQPHYNGGHQMHNNGGMHGQLQYFGQPMDGTVGYDVPPPPQRSVSTTMLATKPSPFGGDHGFGATLQREHQEKMTKRQRILNAMPHKPPAFDPQMRTLLRNVPNPEELASIYLDLGGNQHVDGIDTELIVAVTKYCMDSNIPGSILIFLPGYDDINEVKDKIIAQCVGLHHKPQIFTLHSQMNSHDQQKVFDPPDMGHRKVILSTNIAEASLTIDDVVFVIDTGKVKEKTYDHNSRISQLKVTPIAKSNAEQRSGRAGRCREGFCFRLYSINDFERMLPTQMAEMQRSAIHDVCLHAKMFAPDNMTVRQFLQMAPEPPPAAAIDNSMTFLEQLGALYSESSTSDMDEQPRGFGMLPREPLKEPEMTALGRYIAQLPLEPQLARLLLFGLALKCLSSVVTLVACLSHRDPFLLPLSEERERANSVRDRFGMMDFSDHITLLRAINEFDNKPQKDYTYFCRQNFLSMPGMRMILGIRKQLLCEMKRCQLIDYDGDPHSALLDKKYNLYSDCWPMVQVAIVAGCYPGIGFTKSGSKMRKIRTTSEKNATLHPSSIIKRQLMSVTKLNGSNSGPQVEFLAFQEFNKLDEGLTLRTVTAVPPLAIVLSAGGLHLKQSISKDFRITSGQEGDSEDEEEAEEQQQQPTGFGIQAPQQILELEDWINLRGPPVHMRYIVRLRFKLMAYFLEVIGDPKLLRNEKAEHMEMLNTLSQVVREDHERCGFTPVKNIAPSPRVSSYGGYNNGSNWNNRQNYNNNNYSNNNSSNGNDQYNAGRKVNVPPPVVYHEPYPQQHQQQQQGQFNDMRRNGNAAPQQVQQQAQQHHQRPPSPSAIPALPKECVSESKIVGPSQKQQAENDRHHHFNNGGNGGGGFRGFVEERSSGGQHQHQHQRAMASEAHSNFNVNREHVHNHHQPQQQQPQPQREQMHLQQQQEARPSKSQQFEDNRKQGFNGYRQGGGSNNQQLPQQRAEKSDSRQNYRSNNYNHHHQNLQPCQDQESRGSRFSEKYQQSQEREMMAAAQENRPPSNVEQPQPQQRNDVRAQQQQNNGNHRENFNKNCNDKESTSSFDRQSDRSGFGNNGSSKYRNSRGSYYRGGNNSFRGEGGFKGGAAFKNENFNGRDGGGFKNNDSYNGKKHFNKSFPSSNFPSTSSSEQQQSRSGGGGYNNGGDKCQQDERREAPSGRQWNNSYSNRKQQQQQKPYQHHIHNHEPIPDDPETRDARDHGENNFNRKAAGSDSRNHKNQRKNGEEFLRTFVNSNLKTQSFSRHQ